MGRPRTSPRNIARALRAATDYYAANQQQLSSSTSIRVEPLLTFGLSALVFFVSGMVTLRLLQLLLEGWLHADHVLSGALATCCTLGVFGSFDWTPVRSKKDRIASTPIIAHRIATVLQRGKARQPRRVRRATRIRLLAQLRNVFSACLPKRCRQAPTLNALCIARCLNTLPTEMIYEVFDACWKQMRKKKDQISRVALLRLAHALVSGLGDSSMSDRVYKRVCCGEAATLLLLEEPALSMATRQAAFALLDLLLHKQVFGCEDRPRLLDVCLDAIKHHCKSGENYGITLRTNVMRSMDQAVYMGDSSVGRVIDDYYALRFIFEGIFSEDTTLSGESTHLLESVLRYATPAERICIITRHFVTLKRAFCTMSIVDLASIMAGCEEVGGVVLDEPKILRSIAHNLGVHHVREGDEEQICRAAILLLDFAMLSGAGHLENCLVLGFLKAARYFANDTGNGHGPYIAPILARVLREAPAWSRKVKDWTEGGPADNSVARLGRRIRLRAPRPSATYFLN